MTLRRVRQASGVGMRPTPISQHIIQPANPRPETQPAKGKGSAGQAGHPDRSSEEPIRQASQPARNTNPNSTTHYGPSGSVPEPRLDDPRGHQGSGRFGAVSLADPPAADFGTASPCGGRLYGGPARALTFGLFGAMSGFLADHPKHSGLSLDNRGMERKTTPIAFFTERSLAAYLAVSDRTIRNWIRRGELASYKLGASRRIDPADVDAFLAERRDETA